MSATDRLQNLLQSTALPFTTLSDAIADNILPLLPSHGDSNPSNSLSSINPLRRPPPLLLSARSWRAALIGVASDISPGAVPPETALAMPCSHRCRLCRTQLPPEHVRRRFRICGPGGTYCKGFESDAEVKKHFGSVQYSAFVREGLKERWRRPVHIPLVARSQPHFVHLAGLIPDTTASNVHLFDGCHRVNVLFNDMRDHFPVDEIRLRSFYHVAGESEAIVSFDDKAIAQYFVSMINQGDGFAVLGQSHSEQSPSIKTVVKARLLETDDEQVACIEKMTAEAKPEAREWKPRVSFRV